MKNLIIIGLILIVLWVLYSLNVQYGWVELQLGWTKIAIGIAAAGGPLKYIKQKMDDKALTKEELETKFKYRTLEQSDFIERQRNYKKRSSDKKKSTDAPLTNRRDDFSINEPTLG